MDGLKCKETKLSELLSATEYFRLEAEYYTAETVIIEKSFKGKDIIAKVQYGTSKYCDEDHDGYPVLRLNELNNGFIEEPKKFCHIMSEKEFESLRLHKGDVVIIRTNGNPNLVGRSAVILEDTDIAFASYLYRVVPNDKICSEMLVVFLNSKYGRLEINKNSMKGNQTNFSPAKLMDIIVPNFEKNIQEIICCIIHRAYDLRKKATDLYQRAEQLFVSKLSLNSIPTTAISINTIRTSFGETGRLDAEYYQPKYEKFAEALNTEETVSSLCNIYDKNYVPVDTEEYQYIELANVGMSGEISGVEIQKGNYLPTRARRLVKAGQVIISSIEGSLQSCALITEEFDNALCSTGFYVLDSEVINSETLLVLFKSEPIQALLKQRCSGTILTAISKDEFMSMPLPKIDDDTQKEIAAKVQESFALRRKSKQLLDYAKQAVEMAIEKGEDVAFEWLQERVDG